MYTPYCVNYKIPQYEFENFVLIAGGFLLVFSQFASLDAARLPLLARELAEGFVGNVALAGSTSSTVLVVNVIVEAAGCMQQQ